MDQLTRMQQQLDRMERTLSVLRKELMQEKKKETWVKAQVITELTGWDFNGMKKARENGYIQYKNTDGFWYLLESLHPVHIKKQLA
jgi:hypothetical protein